jgi:hypothetical protein
MGDSYLQRYLHGQIKSAQVMTQAFSYTATLMSLQLKSQFPRVFVSAELGYGHNAHMCACDRSSTLHSCSSDQVWLEHGLHRVFAGNHHASIAVAGMQWFHPLALTLACFLFACHMQITEHPIIRATMHIGRNRESLQNMP